MTGEFDLHAEMVAAPDGRRWVVEARRPRARAGVGVTMLVVRTLADADAVVWREVLPPEADPVVHVAMVATTIRGGGWPGEAERPRPATYWSPSVLALLWLVLVTPLALLAWLRWVSGDASALAPLLLTVVWAATGALVALAYSRPTSS